MSGVDLRIRVGDDGSIALRKAPSLRGALAGLLDVRPPVRRLPTLSAEQISESGFRRVAAGMIGAIARAHERPRR